MKTICWIFLLIPFTHFAQPSIVGTWGSFISSERTFQRPDVVVNFKADLTLQMGQSFANYQASGNYKIDTKKEPIWVDYTVTNPKTQQKTTLLGIISWIDEHTYKVEWSLPGMPRPYTFSDETGNASENLALFKRLNEKGEVLSMAPLRDPVFSKMLGKWNLKPWSKRNDYQVKSSLTWEFLENYDFRQTTNNTLVPGQDLEGSFDVTNKGNQPHFLTLQTGQKNIHCLVEFLGNNEFKVEVFQVLLDSDKPTQFSDITYSNAAYVDRNIFFATRMIASNITSSPEQLVVTSSAVNETPKPNPIVVKITSTPGESIKDIDGNTYKTIVLGNGQQWMAENLRTARFSNGDKIPEITKGKEWYQSTFGAWCNYNNNVEFNVSYGKLYNWFAVADKRNLCPMGWHVATLADWNNLVFYLDPKTDTVRYMGDNVAGSKLKSTDSKYWLKTSKNASNEIGFTALSAGERIGSQGFASNPSSYGKFDLLGNHAFFWTATKVQEKWRNEAHYFFVSDVGVGGDAAPLRTNFTYGYSVRCIKD